MRRRLKGRVVLITGGSRGIGRAIVVAAAKHGANVMFCSRSMSDEAQATLDEARAYGRAEAVAANVSDEADVAQLFHHVRGVYGEVDVLISNAAVSVDRLAVQMSDEAWDEVIHTDLLGPILLAQQMVKAPGPKNLVFIGSVSDLGAVSQANYAAAKAGLHGVVQSLAAEFGPRGVTANILVPGYVKTSMSDRLPEHYKRLLVDLCPLRREGTPEEVAATAMFLSTTTPELMNGQSIRVTGGLVEVPA